MRTATSPIGLSTSPPQKIAFSPQKRSLSYKITLLSPAAHSTTLSMANTVAKTNVEKCAFPTNDDGADTLYSGLPLSTFLDPPLPITSLHADRGCRNDHMTNDFAYC